MPDFAASADLTLAMVAISIPTFLQGRKRKCRKCMKHHTIFEEILPFHMGLGRKIMISIDTTPETLRVLCIMSKKCPCAFSD